MVFLPDIQFKLNMIYEELKYYLTQVSGTATVDLFDRAIALFDLYQLPEYMDVFDRVLGDYLSSTEQESSDALTMTLNEFLDELLKGHGVFTTDEATTSLKIDLGTGIYLLQHFEDWKSIAAITSSDVATMEIFAELMELVTSHKTDTILPFLDSVEDALISKIRNELVEPKAELLAEVEEVQSQLDNYRKFKIRNRNNPIWADKFFGHVDSIGLPFHTYLCIYLQEVGPKLSINQDAPMPIKDVAEDLFSIMCLSEEGIGKTKETIRKYSDSIYSDLKSISILDSAISDLVMEFSHNE